VSEKDERTARIARVLLDHIREDPSLLAPDPEAEARIDALVSAQPERGEVRRLVDEERIRAAEREACAQLIEAMPVLPVEDAREEYAAAMREALEPIRHIALRDMQAEWLDQITERARAALATDAGTALLERLRKAEADRDAVHAWGHKMEAERDAALARAEKAEAELRVVDDDCIQYARKLEADLARECAEHADAERNLNQAWIERDAARAVLRRVQWVRTPEGVFCPDPDCRMRSMAGHAPDCALTKALGGGT
jgi:hypothetical protein